MDTTIDTYCSFYMTVVPGRTFGFSLNEYIEMHVQQNLKLSIHFFFLLIFNIFTFDGEVLLSY